jgi:hypothetical protein
MKNNFKKASIILRRMAFKLGVTQPPLTERDVPKSDDAKTKMEYYDRMDVLVDKTEFLTLEQFIKIEDHIHVRNGFSHVSAIVNYFEKLKELTGIKTLTDKQFEAALGHYFQTLFLRDNPQLALEPTTRAKVRTTPLAL